MYFRSSLVRAASHTWCVNRLILALAIALALVLTACETSIPANWRELRDNPPRSDFDGADELHSAGVYVIDFESGEALFGKNETEKLYPASTVKIMTALITLEEIGEGEALYETIEVPQIAFAKFDTDDPNSQGGSMAGYRPGQRVTYFDALYGLMLASGNDAANTLAYNVGGGDIEAFVALMNDKAAEIGCINTKFANAHGLLEEESWSCAYDLALIARYAYEKFELFREICGTDEYFITEDRKYTNSNALIRNREENPFYREYVKGIKNGALDYIFYRESVSDDEDDSLADDGVVQGWVKRDGIANLVSIGEAGGKLYIVVTLEAPYTYGTMSVGRSRLQNAYFDHISLYEWLIETATTH